MAQARERSLEAVQPFERVSSIYFDITVTRKWDRVRMQGFYLFLLAGTNSKGHNLPYNFTRFCFKTKNTFSIYF